MILVLAGAIMYFAGFICRKYRDDYSKYPNLTCGYRFKSAMANKQKWDEANVYVYRASVVSLVFSIISAILLGYFRVESTAAHLACLAFIIIYPIAATEIHIRKMN